MDNQSWYDWELYLCCFKQAHQCITSSCLTCFQTVSMYNVNLFAITTERQFPLCTLVLDTDWTLMNMMGLPHQNKFNADLLYRYLMGFYFTVLLDSLNKIIPNLNKFIDMKAKSIVT